MKGNDIASGHATIAARAAALADPDGHGHGHSRHQPWTLLGSAIAPPVVSFHLGSAPACAVRITVREYGGSLKDRGLAHGMCSMPSGLCYFDGWCEGAPYPAV